MKKLFYAVIVMLVAGLFSCRKENITIADSNKNDSGSKAVTSNSDIPKPYFPVTITYYIKIGSFVMNGEDQTIHYNLYDFELQGNVISANSGLFGVVGKWYREPGAASVYIMFDYAPLPEVIGYFFKNLSEERWMIVHETRDNLHLVCFDNGNEKKLRFDIKKIVESE